MTERHARPERPHHETAPMSPCVRQAILDAFQRNEISLNDGYFPGFENILRAHLDPEADPFGERFL